MKIKKETYQRSALIFSLTASIFFFWTINSFWANDTEVEYVQISVEKPYPQRVGDDQVEIDAAAALSIFWNGEKERVLYSKNVDSVLPIASISKVFTALVVWENYALEEPIGIKEGVYHNLRIWNDTRIKDVLYPLLLESNNTIANILAIQDKRFLENSFIEEMNKKAEEMQLKNTSFVNPSGLDEKDTANLSTAKDLYLLIKYVIENTDLFSIMNTPSYKVYSFDRSVYYTTVSTNQFLFTENNDWEKRIVGGKTGFTFRALGCLLLVIESPKENGYIINIILGAEDRFKEMEKMVNFAHQAYKY